MGQPDQLRRTGGPSVPQQDIVEILKWNASQLANEVDRIQQILDRKHLQTPGTLLLPDYLTQRRRRCTMPAAGIDINQGDLPRRSTCFDGGLWH
jgi:hypothetical protein